MRRLLAGTALALVAVAGSATPSHADPLICVDITPLHAIVQSPDNVELPDQACLVPNP